MFTVAGRMIGHSFLHRGPGFSGLSPAIIHILFGGSLETTPVTIQDCPDLDIRDIVKMVRIKFNWGKRMTWKIFRIRFFYQQAPSVTWSPQHNNKTAISLIYSMCAAFFFLSPLCFIPAWWRCWIKRTWLHPSALPVVEAPCTKCHQQEIAV